MRLQHYSAIVADDHKALRDLVADILRSAGMRDIRLARDGAEAFHMVCTRSPDMVILDLDMLRDGLNTLRQIRTGPHNHNRRVPVIMITNMTTQERIIALRDAGANEILGKPLTTAKLLGRVKSMLLSPRPFIDTTSYFGPDRRHREREDYSGPLRRASDRRRDVVEIA